MFITEQTPLNIHLSMCHPVVCGLEPLSLHMDKVSTPRPVPAVTRALTCQMRELVLDGFYSSSKIVYFLAGTNIRPQEICKKYVENKELYYLFLFFLNVLHWKETIIYPPANSGIGYHGRRASSHKGYNIDAPISKVIHQAAVNRENKPIRDWEDAQSGLSGDNVYPDGLRTGVEHRDACALGLVENPKTSIFFLGHTFFYVFSKVRRGSFSWIFWLEASFLCKIGFLKFIFCSKSQNFKVLQIAFR